MKYTNFRTHSLSAQSTASLMQRQEFKFLIQRSELNGFIQQLSSNYSILKIDERNQFHYQSLYFDTPNSDFYNMHHNGKLSRQKVRVRHYVDTHQHFLEVKAKNNKEISNKFRLKVDKKHLLNEINSELVYCHTGLSLGSLAPSLFVSYFRVTFMNFERSERITLDTNLRFYSPKSRQLQQISSSAIVEVKTVNRIQNSMAVHLLKKHRIKPSSFSKYCVGLGLTNRTNLKTNRFKPLLNRMLSASTPTNPQPVLRNHQQHSYSKSNANGIFKEQLQ